MVAAHFPPIQSEEEGVGGGGGGHGRVLCCSGGGGGQSQTDRHRQVGGRCKAPTEDRSEVKH